MQHGNANFDFCDTSRTRTTKIIKILLLWILVDFGKVKCLSCGRLLSNSKIMKILIIFEKKKNVKIENVVVKPIGGSKICRRKGYNNKPLDSGPEVFFVRETELCQNCYQTRVLVTLLGPLGSTIIFFWKKKQFFH